MINKDEFCKYIKQYEKAMYFLAYSIVENEQDAADIVGESILKAYSNLNKLNSKKAFKTWILRIVHNTAIEYIRKNKVSVDVDEIDIIDEKNVVNNIENKIVLRDAIESLKQPYRTVLVLFYYENLSIYQIANITGNNVLAIRQQLSRGRKMLKNILEEFMYG